MSTNHAHLKPEQTPSIGKMCGGFHEAYRLIGPIQKEVLKILSKLPKHNPIIFDDINWVLFETNTSYVNKNFGDIERATQGCEQGNLELCAHPQPGFNEDAGKLRHQNDMQLLELKKSPYVPREYVDSLCIQRDILDAQVQLRDVLLVDYMRTLYLPSMQGKWVFHVTTQDLASAGLCSYLDFDLFRRAHLMMAADDFFTGEDRPQMQAFFRHMQTITLHIMAQYHDFYHERETLMEIAGINN